MKNTNKDFCRHVVMAVLLLIGSSQLLWSAGPEDTKNRFDVSYRPAFNITASFKNVGGAAFPNNPSVTGNSYQDGFVGTDDTGNALDLTTYWGYSSTEDQVVGDNLLMRSSQSGTYANGRDEDPQQGIEIRYARELGKRNKIAWGAEFAFAYTDLSIQDNGNRNQSVISVDAFPLGGISPPLATPDDPYIGPAVAGPGAPLLGTSATGVPVTLVSDFEANVFSFRLGPYAEIALSKRIAVSVSTGYSLLLIDSTFSCRESVALPGGGVVTQRDSSSDSDWASGWYVATQCSVELNKSINAFTGVQFQAAETYQQRTGDKIADIDFGQTLFFVVGLGCRF